jgi:heme A synthase
MGLVIATSVLFKSLQANAAAWRWWKLLVATVIFQGALGYVQHFNGLPVVLVATHVFGAVLLWNVTLFTARHAEYSDWTK